MEKKELAFSTNISIKSYQCYAFPLGMLFAENEEYLPWVLNNFIQLRVDFGSATWFDYNELHYQFWPILEHCKLDRGLIVSSKIDLIQFFIESINNDYYIDTSVDQYYIEHKWNYMEKHVGHGVVIYGYDKIKQYFMVAGYTKNNVFEKFTINFSDMQKSCNSECYPTVNFRVNYRAILFKKSKTYQYVGKKIDEDLIRIGIIEYLNSENRTNRYMSHVAKREDIVVGVKACLKLLEYLYEYKNSRFLKEPIDFKAFYVLYEHKRCMFMRLEYFEHKYEVLKLNKICERYKKIEKNSEILLNLILKFAISSNIRILDRCLEKLEFIIKEEQTILNDFIQFTNSKSYEHANCMI